MGKVQKFQERSGNSKKDLSENPRTNIISESKNKSVHRINRLYLTEDSSIKIIQITEYAVYIFCFKSLYAIYKIQGQDKYFT